MTSTSVPPAVPPKKRGGLRVFLLVLGCAALPVVALLGWYVIGRIKDASVARQLEKEARQRGEPVTLAELTAKRPAVPDAENAAIALMGLWKTEDPELWEAFLKGSAVLPDRTPREYPESLPYLGREARPVVRGVALPAETRREADEFMKEQAPHLRAVQEALRRPRCQWPGHFSAGYLAPLPYLAPLKEEGSLLRLQALLATDRGDVNQAIESLGAILEVSRTLADDPLLISQLVRLSCLQMAMEGSEQLLSRHALTVEQLGRMEALNGKMELGEALRQALIAERTMGLSMFEMSGEALARMSQQEQGGGALNGPAGYHAGMTVFGILGLRAADRRLMWETMSEALQIASSDSPDRFQRVKALEDSLEKKVHQFPPKIMCGLTLPALSRAQFRFGTCEARRRAMQVALGIERYRAAHQGALPTQAAELVPQVLAKLPADPFDGQPLRYRTLAKGYVVYSIGADGRDNGGKERPAKGAAKDYDETFSVAR